MKTIKIAQNDEEIENCFPVMKELRPRFEKREFLAQVKRQMKNSNFQMIYLQEKGEVKAVGGIRINEWLAGGKYLEIEDLVSKSGERSKGFGGELFDWICEFAKRENCAQIKLVSHVKRFGAHKFYLNKGMIIEAHYFSMVL
jgi:GNAT superfamily N-acetyltransferase